MNLQQLIHSRAFRLSSSQSPALDALLLLCHTLGMDKEQLYSRLDSSPNRGEVLRFDRLISRRENGEPVAYIVGKKEFYGLSFYVDHRVLVPRPDSETLVDWVLDCHGNDDGSTDGSSESGDTGGLRLHDCCSGSGAIAIALQSERPTWHVSASDLSLESGEVFAFNWAGLIATGDVPWQQRNLLSLLALPDPPVTAGSPATPGAAATAGSAAAAGAGAEGFHIITANPPYLTSAETKKHREEGWKEPEMALDGGEDGLEYIRALIAQAKNYLFPDGILYIEGSHSQIDQIFTIFKEEGFADLEYKEDLAGMKRVARGKMI